MTVIRTCQLLLLLVVASCVGQLKPMAGPSLSALPHEAVAKGEYLERAFARPTPESRVAVPKKLQRAEQVLATLAAVVAALLSSNMNSMVGFGVSFEENSLFGDRSNPTQAPPAPKSSEPEDAQPSFMPRR